jgi:hypothetical protein
MNLLAFNMGATDRIIRVILGVILIINVFWGLETPLGWIGVILLVTGLAGICPLYSILGFSTKGGAEKPGE